jgi:uncharacterized protein YegP (UPF0339 family)
MSNGLPPTIFIDIYKSRTERLLRRPQPWRWRALSEGNRKVLASGEAYTNREDCLSVIRLLFADNTANVFLRRREADGWPAGTPLGLDRLRQA